MECPGCKGEGNHKGYGCPGFKLITINCDICKGTGQMPDGMKYDPERGKFMKECRLASRSNMLEQAKKLNIPLAELSRRERGFFEEAV